MARSTRRGRTSSWGSNSSSTSSGHKEQQQPQAAASIMPLNSSASSTTSAFADANNGTTFPKKLAEMLGNETQSVTWSSHGLSFFICDQHDLTYTLLPKYFRHNKLTSFQRQLNLYGFRRITKGIDTGAYFHPQFRRDRPDLVPKIRRLPGQGATATAKFLPLYYKDVQNSSPKGSVSATSAVTAAAAAASAAMTFSSLPSPGRRRSNSSTSNSRRRRRFRSESIASTLSHASSSECSSVYVESCDGDDIVGYMGEVGDMGSGPCTGSATGSSNTSSNNSYMGGQAYEDDEPEFTFMDPPSLSVVTSNESDLSMVSEDGSIDSSNNSVNVPFANNGEDMVGYGYGASAPAPKLPSFQQYWQPFVVSTGTGTGTGTCSTTATKAMTTTAAAAAAATTTTTIHTEAASSLPPLSGSLAAPPTIRFTTTSSIPAEREHHHQPHAMRNSSSALRPPSTSSSPLPATFSANSFSLWLNGAPLPHQQQQQPQHHQQPQQQVHHHTTGGNQQQQQQQRQAQLDGPLALATDASAAVAMSAPSASGPMSPPPPPKPLLVKRCSSINSELWRGWGSSEDLQALVELETSIDEIFGSFGPETETVLQSVGLEITSDSSLRPDPSVALSLSLGSSTTTPATAGAAGSGLVAFSGITAA